MDSYIYGIGYATCIYIVGTLIYKTTKLIYDNCKVYKRLKEEVKNQDLIESNKEL
jgi:predicted polyphosphate/ATP-dependent NAD kinase